MAAQSLKLSWLALLGAAAGGCTVWNDVDVCERPPAPVQDLNRRTENNQFFSGMDQLVPAAQNTWLSVWTSDLESTSLGIDRSDIRIGRLDAQGAPLSSCGEEAELTVVEATPGTDTVSNAYAPSLIAPRAGNDEPLLLWGTDDGSTTTLFGEVLTNQGCHSVSPEPFVIRQLAGVCGTFRGRSLSAASRCLVPARAAALDSTDRGGDQYVLTWIEQHGVEPGTLMARVLEYKAGEKFLPTALDKQGEAASLLQGSHTPLWFDLVGLDDGHWAIAWVEDIASIQTAWFQLWNDRLEPLTEPINVHKGPIPDSVNLDVARVGDDVGVTFVASTGVYAAVASGKDGHVLVRHEVPSGKVDWVRITADSKDGVALSWTENGRILLQLLGRNLSPRFNNQSCDSTPFVVDGGSGSAQREDLAFDAQRGLLLAWTSSDAGGDDRSGTALRGRYYARSVLEP